MRSHRSLFLGLRRARVFLVAATVALFCAASFAIMSFLGQPSNAFARLADWDPLVFSELLNATLCGSFCTVLTIGDELILRASPQAIATRYPRCIVRATALNNQLRKWSGVKDSSPRNDTATTARPPTTANFVFDRVRLVGDDFDLLPMPDFHLNEAWNLRMSTYLSSLPPNRIAVIVARLQTMDNVRALQAALERKRKKSFAVVLQECRPPLFRWGISSDSDVRDLARSLLFRHGFTLAGCWTFAPTAEDIGKWCPNGLVEELFGSVPVESLSTQSEPIEPLPLIGFTRWGRFTNNVLEFSGLVAIARELNRTVVVPDTAPADCFLFINSAQLSHVFADPNQVVCHDEAIVLTNGSWPASVGYLRLGIPDRWTSKLEDLVETVARAAPRFRKDSPLIVPGNFLFYGHFWGESRDPSYFRRAWLTFSPAVDEVAETVFRVYERATKQFHSAKLLGADELRPIILGMHVRLTDYKKKSALDHWKVASQTASGLAPRPVGGLVLCSDDSSSTILLELRKLWAHVPYLGCVSNIFPVFEDPALDAVHMAVVQTVLARVDCFIGLNESSFAWRIQARRELEGRASSCDAVV